MFLEMQAGEGDAQSSLFGLSGLFGSSGGASDPANQTNEIDKTDHPPRLARPACLASRSLDARSVSSISPYP